MEGTNMSGKEVEIIGSNTASAISYAQNIENGMKDSLNQAKDLKAYVTGAKWNGKTGTSTSTSGRLK